MVDVVVQPPNDPKSRVYKSNLTQAQVDALALDFTVYTVTAGIVSSTGVGPTRALAVPKPDVFGAEGVYDFINYPGSPVGVLTPTRVGQRCQDTTTGEMYTATSLTTAGWVSHQSAAREAVRTPLLPDGQPLTITKPVTSIGKLACNFATGLWSINAGSPTLTQGYTGWNGSGTKTGVVSRTGQAEMLKVVPAANTTEEIVLGSFSTNMLTKSLGGVIGLWVYVETLPGYEANGAGPSGSISLTLSTNAASNTNALNVGFNANQVREGWNFLKFVMRNFNAYLPGSGVTEYHPFGVSATSFGTGVDGNILSSDLARLKIGWTNMSGATLYFDSIWTGFASKGQIVLGNDGGANVVELALPLFKQYGWVGYTAFPFRVWSSGSYAIADLSANTSPTGLALYNAGWDFVNHTANHIANGTLTSEAAIAYEMETARAWQASLDLVRGGEFYASPQSSSSRLSESVIRQMGFKAQRHARKWNVCITPFGVDNPHHLGAIDMGSVSAGGVSSVTSGAAGSVAGWQTYTKLKRAIDVTIAYGDTLFPFWHGITTLGDSGSGDDLTGDNLLLTYSAFQQTVEYIRTQEQAGNLTVARGFTGFWYGGGR